MRKKVKKIIGLIQWALFQPNVRERVRKAKKVIKDHNLKQGQYAQLIVRTYKKWYKKSIFFHIKQQIPRGRFGRDRFHIVNPFRYTVVGSLMGGQKKMRRPVKARHVREFVRLLKSAKPGRYIVYEKE